MRATGAAAARSSTPPPSSRTAGRAARRPRARRRGCAASWPAAPARQGLRDPEALGSQLALLIDGVAARVVVDGPQAAPGAVADATAAARALVAAA